MHKINSLVFFLFLSLIHLAYSQESSSRILLIPLDDRPPCYQFPKKIAEISDAEVVSPPDELLGWFTDPGKSDELLEWMLEQDYGDIDAVVVAMDMLTYGGLVAARVHGVEEAKAIQRMEILEQVKALAPDVPFYFQNVIMRLAPTADGKNESYRVQLAEWAEVSVQDGVDAVKRTEELNALLPKEVISDYLKTRKRNLHVNLKAIELVEKGVIDYLILSQDDAMPEGIHIQDREKLIEVTKQKGLGEKIAVQPGADETLMLLLARAVNERLGVKPKVYPVYSSKEMSDQIMAFEDRPLRQTVSLHIAATGADEVQERKEADLLYFVFSSRFEENAAGKFTEKIREAIQQGHRVIVADIDPKGNVQGGDGPFTDALISSGVLPLLYGYASWNTTGNTIGTALPHGLVYYAATEKLLDDRERKERVLIAQHWFTFHRVMNDYYYNNLTRDVVNKAFNQYQQSSRILSDEQRAEMEALGMREMQQHFSSLAAEYFSALNYEQQNKLRCLPPSSLEFQLPWNRTFEAHVGFELDCALE
ncbi:DUF4127 family protein [Pleomorphovibrio marinus]|uniref:DUF4127 family protein n=1 Tax=Pleomorphovibrio marinus TaxID=2164132 RepID=UPI0013007C40|nr:DUF4127 family protein [Pleomorphovibrio marinus]